MIDAAMAAGVDPVPDAAGAPTTDALRAAAAAFRLDELAQTDLVEHYL